MKTLLAAVLLALLGTACVTTPAGQGRLNLDEHGVALHGYDPVSYHQKDGPKKGEPRWTADHDGATYWFTSDESRIRFLQSPDYYVPRYGGWCAYAMADGERVDVDPEAFLVTPEGLFLFYRSFLIDTKERWEKQGHEKLKSLADEAWLSLNLRAPRPASAP